MITLRKTGKSRGPYVGPRPFTADDRLYGREREGRALRDVLIAERIVLLHSPSGGGKTSLIQSALVPALRKKRFDIVGPLRVNAPPPDTGVNRYLWSALLDVRDVAAEDAGGSLAAALDRLDEQEQGDGGGPPRRRVLIFDQFEEVLTLDPTDRAGQEGFFRDVGLALDNEQRWALFSMREDYMGGLARYAVWIPTHLRVRFRLDFLEREPALDAVQRPAAERNVEFTLEAARELVGDLARVRVQVPNRDEPEDVDSPYVEPFQLQVACADLWQTLGRVKRIQPQHVRKHDFDGAMGRYYAQAVAEVAAVTETGERAIRDWFEDALITRQGFRRQSSTGPKGAADVYRVLSELEERYVLRSENRRGTNWYELAHDNLVRPVKQDNAVWRQFNLPRWEVAAEQWKRSDRRPEYLAHGPDIAAARKWLKEHDEAEHPIVREYVDASARARGRSLAAFIGGPGAFFFWLALGELVVIALLVAR